MKTILNGLKFYLILSVICLINFQVGAQSVNSKDSIDIFLQNKMQKLNIPGLQLAVIRDGKLVKLKSYGIANVENSIDVTNSSVFSINSCTKAFVGVAVMQLQEEGKLNVNDYVSKYIDSLPSDWRKITIRQVLSNTSGLPNIIDQYENIFEGGDEKKAWEKVKTLPAEFKAGEKFSYNQTGYVMVGKIINKVSGISFVDFIKQRQFDVAGMNTTQFGDSGDVIFRSAGGYSMLTNDNGNWTGTKKLKNIFVTFPPYFRACSGILSTAEDLSKWLIALQNGQLLKDKQSIDILWSSVKLNNGSVSGLNKLVNSYALGWPVVVRDEHPAVAPVGGMRSSFFVYPKDDLSIIVLTNLQGANPEWFIDEIAGYYIPEMHQSNGFGLSASMKILRLALIKDKYYNAEKTVSKLKKNKQFAITEDDINDFGYRLLNENKYDQALKVFELNVRLFPTSSNAYDSYGEALAVKGDIENSVKNYKKSLKFNPDNANAAEQILKLKKLK